LSRSREFNVMVSLVSRAEGLGLFSVLRQRSLARHM